MTLIVNINSELPYSLIGDEVRLRQILLNLLGNAVKYTKEGYVSMTVDGEVRDDSVTLTVEITDSGMGIKEEDLPKLFGEFSRVDVKANQGIEGTGLGLAITRNLCRLMDGDVTIYSEYGKGSTFTVTLPQKIDDHNPFAAVEHPEQHKVLIYETRLPYANSMVCSVDNLGVRCTLVLTEADFEKELTANAYSYVFVASNLFRMAKDMVERLHINTTLVLLAEFGDTVYQPGIRSINMPIHSISIANILNGVEDQTAYSDMRREENQGIRFTAPTARILVVDDIATNLKVARGLLAPYKAQVDCCFGGAEAIELIRQYNYDMILMDHMMPEMDGIETTRAIRTLQDGYYAALPIVALTANAISGMKEMFLQNGFDDYLAKPIELVKLNHIMYKWIPKEKQKKSEPSPPPAPVSQISSFTIEGLDVSKGLIMSGGSMEGYKEVLALYCQDIHQRMNILNTVPDEDNIGEFTTQVHALKSASASIGALAVSQEAALLEEAGKKRELHILKDHLPGFCKELSRLSEEILKVIRPEQPAPDQLKASGPMDKEILQQLDKALRDQDIGKIDSLLETLLQSAHSQKDRDSLSSISDCALISEFDEALTLLTDYIKELNDEQ